MRPFRGSLICEMVKLGHDVYVCAPDYTDTTRRQAAELGAVPVDYRMDRTGAHVVKEMMAIVRLGRLLKGLRVDVCFGFMAKPVVYGSIAAFFAGVPNRYSMVEGLGYFFTEGDQRPGVRKALIRYIITLLYRVSLPLNRTVFFLNPDDARDLAASTSSGRYSTVVLNGIGIDTREYASAPLHCERITFLLVGRLLKEKGVREYVSAAGKLKQAYPHVHFALVGPGDTNPGGIAEDETRGWVANGKVDWPGGVADTKPWYRASCVYVLPSYYREGLPRSTLEAMAMGRPIITTDATGCRETVQRLGSRETLKLKPGRFPITGRVIQGRNGFLVPVRDVDALAEAMECFVVNPELIPQMGAESRKLAEERFDVRKVNARILQEMGL